VKGGKKQCAFLFVLFVVNRLSKDKAVVDCYNCTEEAYNKCMRKLTVEGKRYCEKLESYYTKDLKIIDKGEAVRKCEVD